jgi:hypothetical protein
MTKSVPVPILQHAYQAFMAARPDKSRFVLVDRHAGSIEIFDSRGTLTHRVSGPTAFEPKFTVATRGGQPVFASGEDLRFGYMGVAATQSRIYALFSGRRRGDYPGTATEADALHVFDWDGRLLTTAHLPTPAVAIAVGPRDSLAYVLVDEPAPSVFEYQLPVGDHSE